LLVSQSEFGRTLTSNGPGTDHGWAGNHFIDGGGIRGGRILNEFPTSLREGSLQDVGRGRVIPKYPWESMMVPIARWLDVDDEIDLDSIFPNLGNFDKSEHIIGDAELFQAVDCEFGWDNSWTDCSVSCGGGAKNRASFTVTRRAKFGGRECDTSTPPTETCGEQACGPATISGSLVKADLGEAGFHMVVSGSRACDHTGDRCIVLAEQCTANSAIVVLPFAHGNRVLPHIGVTCCDSAGMGSRPGCITGDFETGLSACRNAGLDLCTAEQIKKGSGEDTGCHFDRGMVWTKTSCDRVTVEMTFKLVGFPACSRMTEQVRQDLVHAMKSLVTFAAGQMMALTAGKRGQPISAPSSSIDQDHIVVMFSCPGLSLLEGGHGMQRTDTEVKVDIDVSSMAEAVAIKGGLEARAAQLEEDVAKEVASMTGDSRVRISGTPSFAIINGVPKFAGKY